MESPFSETAFDPTDIAGCRRFFEMVIGQLDELHAPVVEEVQKFLANLNPEILKSLEEKKAFVWMLNQVLNRLNQRVECPSCSEPAILGAGALGTAAHGAFRFGHYQGERIRHGSSTILPKLVLVDPKPDARTEIH
jgi:hypothetical protein